MNAAEDYILRRAALKAGKVIDKGRLMTANSEDDKATGLELLELAAKAAGLKFGWHTVFGPMITIFLESNNDGRCPQRIHWNPLNDDGDALRLAVELGLEITPRNGKTFVDGDTDNFVLTRELHEADPYAATRRAIVRAAAEIGRNKEQGDGGGV